MADLTVTLTESGTIAGQTVSDSETITISEIESIYHAKLLTTRNASNDGYLYFGGGGLYPHANGDPATSVKYCRITNVEADGGTDIKVVLGDYSFENTTCYKLEPGQSLILYNFDDYESRTTADSAPPAVTDEIAVFGTNEGEDSPAYIEIFMASTYSG